MKIKNLYCILLIGNAISSATIQIEDSDDNRSIEIDCTGDHAYDCENPDPYQYENQKFEETQFTGTIDVSSGQGKEATIECNDLPVGFGDYRTNTGIAAEKDCNVKFK